MVPPISFGNKIIGNNKAVKKSYASTTGSRPYRRDTKAANIYVLQERLQEILVFELHANG